MKLAVQIRMTPRALTPEEGQEILKRMRDSVPAAAVAVLGTTEVEGMTQRVEWPSWLRTWIEAEPGMELETINWTYTKFVNSRADADKLKNWVDGMKQWCVQNDKEKASNIERLVVDIYEASEVAGLDSF
jgi:hypothetical protein